MADRTAYVYLNMPQERFELSAVVDHLQRHGIGLEYPGTVTVMVLSDHGDQLEQDRTWLFSMVRIVRAISFQWWKSEMDDIYCRIRFKSGTTSIEIGLDGMDRDDEVQFLDALLGLAKRYVADGFLTSCVVDHRGLDVAHFDRLFVDEQAGE